MLPAPGGYRGRATFLPEYIRRAIKYPQMDLEYTFWQMVTLCIDPKKVYKHTTWHKQTKNQWARDDPAFTVLCVGFLLVAAIAYSIAFQITNPWTFLRVVLGTVLFDFVFIGTMLATCTWVIANKYLRVHSSRDVEQEVEWMYSFDVHCNSFFPLFLILYVLQFFLLPLLMQKGFLATFASNTLFLLAIAYYHYITFLGYQALPFLTNSIYFLYPCGAYTALYLVSLPLGINCSQLALSLYFAQ
mmetsp:Transcript_58961/g.120718  ORF Transcript_58961/g.120718 Transcript_58961/m.120718 type:complete len:244 (+) Transcript_58961:401-1132(+)